MYPCFPQGYNNSEIMYIYSEFEQIHCKQKAKLLALRKAVSDKEGGRLEWILLLSWNWKHQDELMALYTHTDIEIDTHRHISSFMCWESLESMTLQDQWAHQIMGFK